MKKASEILGLEQSVAPIGLIVPQGAEEMGAIIDQHLRRWSPFGDESFIVGSSCPRFSSGDSKGLIKETIRGRDLFL